MRFADFHRQPSGRDHRQPSGRDHGFLVSIVLYIRVTHMSRKAYLEIVGLDGGMVQRTAALQPHIP